MDQPITPTAQWASSASLLVGNRSALDDNSSDEELLDLSVFLRFASNRRVNDTAYYSLICAYSLLIIMGAAGNLLVVYAVVRQPAMRTVRNVFIINLAVSDLLLCVVTMPLTLMEVLSNTWQLGNTPFLCQMVGGMQAVSIFVSTMSIAAIAVDRYQLIVNPTESSFERAGALTTLIAIWVLSILLATPLFIWRTLVHREIPIANFPIQSVDYCIEMWPTKQGRALYSAASILIQYALPIVTVSFAHARICNTLRYRLTVISTTVNDSRKQQARQEQLRKTNTLLVAIAIIFGVCWLPLNIFNVVVDTFDLFGGDTEPMLITYAVCHMTGMSSACANPLLYGWLNDNFRKEFREIWASFCATVSYQKLRCIQRRPNETNEPHRTVELNLNTVNSTATKQLKVELTAQAQSPSQRLSPTCPSKAV